MLYITPMLYVMIDGYLHRTLIWHIISLGQRGFLLSPFTTSLPWLSYNSDYYTIVTGPNIVNINECIGFIWNGQTGICSAIWQKYTTLYQTWQHNIAIHKYSAACLIWYYAYWDKCIFGMTVSVGKASASNAGDRGSVAGSRQLL